MIISLFLPAEASDAIGSRGRVYPRVKLIVR